jgi:hypothetical protein
MKRETRGAIGKRFTSVRKVTGSYISVCFQKPVSEPLSCSGQLAKSMSVTAIYQHLTRGETLTPTLKHHFDGSAHARLHMFRSSRSG